MGECHPAARLSDADVRRILDLREIEGWGVRRIATELAVSIWTVQSIVLYRRRSQVARTIVSEGLCERLRGLREQGRSIRSLAREYGLGRDLVGSILEHWHEQEQAHRQTT